MITFAALVTHPAAFASLSGLNPTDFEALYQDFAAAYAQDRQASLTRAGTQRKRAAGGGAQFSHDGRTRLLMALVWLRIYPTYAVLGFFFSLKKANAQKGVMDVLATLEAHTIFTCERPAKEQRVQRPGGQDESGHSRQKPFYSGKKKTHTLKTQVAVAPDGTFQSVGESVPGSVHDLTLLRRSDLMHRLDKTEVAMMDKGYDGIQTQDPKDPDKNGPLRMCHLPHKARRGHPLTDEQRSFNAHLSRYRIILSDHSRTQSGADEPVPGAGPDLAS